MSDADLIAKALRCGWTWFESLTARWGMPAYPITGWQMSETSFKSCKPEKKEEVLRPEPGRGFDHDLECVECGLPIWLYWMKKHEDELRERRECQDCYHW